MVRLLRQTQIRMGTGNKGCCDAAAQDVAKAVCPGLSDVSDVHMGSGDLIYRERGKAETWTRHRMPGRELHTNPQHGHPKVDTTMSRERKTLSPRFV